MSAQEFIESLVDAGTWQSWDEPVTYRSDDSSYEADLASARLKSGRDESVTTGEGLVRGRRIALVISDFDFLAGSIGLSASERIVNAVRQARTRGLPLLAAPSSGGTRMQEGAIAFVQMLRITEAISELRSAGLPFLVYLRHPTTGGVFASWGSLGHITAAEPGALIGFMGPRVYEGLHGEKFPSGVQVAENLHAHGIVDVIVAPSLLASFVGKVLDVLTSKADLSTQPAHPREFSQSLASSWESIQRSRRLDRPGSHELLAWGAREFVAIESVRASGTGSVLALARFGSMPAVVLAQDRHPAALLGPRAFTTARRGISLAKEMNIPLITLIDTPGAAMSKEAEEGGLAGEIAQCLYDLMSVPVPTVAVLLGQGSGGAALALLPADTVIAAEHAWLAPISPEGASVIRHQNTTAAADMAASQNVGASRLAQAGIVDRLVNEYPDAAEEPRQFIERISEAIEYELWQLLSQSHETRMHTRTARYRSIGVMPRG